jgi:hypothetical protein
VLVVCTNFERHSVRGERADVLLGFDDEAALSLLGELFCVPKTSSTGGAKLTSSRCAGSRHAAGQDTAASRVKVSL